MDTRADSPATSPLLVLISAPSGAGKTTLCEQLLVTRPDLTRVITCTTRAPRPGERDGVDYYFLDPVTFHDRVAAGHFLEHATVFGNRYGTLKSEVLGKLAQGRDVLLNIDIQGAATFREHAQAEPQIRRALVSIFLTPSSMAVLEARLRRRGTDADAVIETRLKVARQEIAQWRRFDYLLISGTVAEDLRRAQVILEAEKLRSERAAAPEF